MTDEEYQRELTKYIQAQQADQHYVPNPLYWTSARVAADQSNYRHNCMGVKRGN